MFVPFPFPPLGNKTGLFGSKQAPPFATNLVYNRQQHDLGIFRRNDQIKTYFIFPEARPKY